MTEPKTSFLSQFTPLQKGLGFVITLIIGLGALVSAVSVIKGNFSLTLWIAAAVTTIGLYAAYLFVKFKRTEIKSELLEPGKSLGKKHIFDSRIRRLADWGISLLTLIIIAFVTGYYIYSIPPTNEVIVLVADFEDPEQPAQRNYKVTAEIVEKLRDRTKDFPNIKIKTLNEHLSFKNTKEEIKNKGAEQKAAIIIWGDIGKTEQSGRLDVNIEILKQPKKLALVSNKVVSRIPANELETYKAQINLSNQLSFFTLVIDGLAQTEAENYDAAIERFTSALNEPDLSNGFVNLSDVYYFRGSLFALKSIYLISNEFSSAINDLNQSLAIKSDFAEAYALRGFCYIQNGQRSLALRDFGRATEIKPNSAINYFFQGLAYYLRYEYDLADDSLKRAGEFEPHEASDFLLRGTTHMFLGEGDIAVSDFKTAAGINSSLNNDALLLTALTKANQNKVDEAIIDLNQLVKNKPDMVFAKVMRAVLLSTKDNPEQALAELTSTINSAPNIDRLYSVRGQIFLSNDRYEEALSDFNKAINLNPQSSENLFNRAQIYAEKKLWNEAIADYNKTIELDPEVAEYYLERGKAFKEVSNFSAAAKDFIKSINLYPQYKDGYIALSKVYAADHKFGEGEISSDQINSMYPANPVEKTYLLAFSYESRCEIYRREKNFDNAVFDCTKAVELLPDLEDAYRIRKEVYFEQSELFETKFNEKEPAIKLLESEIAMKENEINQLNEEADEMKKALDFEKNSYDANEKKNQDLINKAKSNLNLSAEETTKFSEVINESNNQKQNIIHLSNNTAEVLKKIIQLSKELNIAFDKANALQSEQIPLIKKAVELKKLSSEDSSKSIFFLQQEINELKSETEVGVLSRLPSLPLEKNK
jgi:tetratricopeptide (TPR) repeat protein